jgi:hypothetical protein
MTDDDNVTTAEQALREAREELHTARHAVADAITEWFVEWAPRTARQRVIARTERAQSLGQSGIQAIKSHVDDLIGNASSLVHQAVTAGDFPEIQNEEETRLTQARTSRDWTPYSSGDSVRTVQAIVAGRLGDILEQRGLEQPGETGSPWHRSGNVTTYESRRVDTTPTLDEAIRKYDAAYERWTGATRSLHAARKAREENIAARLWDD